MQDTFWQDRIAVTKTLIVAYEGALLALGEGGGIQSYQLDTGQTRQLVTRADIPRLNSMLGSLYNQLATLEARVYGCGVSVGQPSW